MYMFKDFFLIPLSEAWVLKLSRVKVSLGSRSLRAPFQLGRAETGAITKCPAVL